MEAMFAKLVEQLPSAAAILVVVILFIQYIDRRDKAEALKNNETLTALQQLTSAIGTMKNSIDVHHAVTMDAIGDMRKTVAYNRRKEDPK